MIIVSFALSYKINCLHGVWFMMDMDNYLFEGAYFYACLCNDSKGMTF